MLIPITIFLVVFFVFLLVVGGLRRSRVILALLAALLWLLSLVSAFFVGYAWLERSYSEKWAMFGVFFISLPIMMMTSVTAITALIVASVRGVEGRGPLCLSLYLLLSFLVIQVMLSIWAAY